MSGNGNGHDDSVRILRESVEKIESINRSYGEAFDAPPSCRLPSFADMSARERSASMDATVQQVAALSAHHNRMAATIKAQGEDVAALDRRLDSLERLVAARYIDWTERSLLGRLRWLFTGR